MSDIESKEQLFRQSIVSFWDKISKKHDYFRRFLWKTTLYYGIIIKQVSALKYRHDLKCLAKG